jgi:hypothetical protein
MLLNTGKPVLPAQHVSENDSLQDHITRIANMSPFVRQAFDAQVALNTAQHYAKLTQSHEYDLGRSV